MLFNSHAFLFGFLPVVLLAYFAAARRGREYGNLVLALASLFFYAWWDLRYLPLLLASIVGNYACSLQIRAAHGAARQRWLVAALAGNLALLGWYKYAGFLAGSVAQATGWDMPALKIVLPIGISFFTFTQIAFLVDTARGHVSESRFLHYLLFVTYFPHLIAGPVLHHGEMMPQFADDRNRWPRAANFAVGATIFFIGLGKKVLIADSLAPYANVLFAEPHDVSLLVAWGGVLAYAFQLYFDFSGYSDMAIGLSRLFGVQLPLNFASPYKATSIMEFWRRWHMTLSRFLRDYLYIPLGGNRRGPARRSANLMATMLLGGLWHGAGWNFVIWGGLHGLYLVIGQAWRALAQRMGWRGGTAGALAGWALTFAAVCVAWVFFRAPDLDTALAILSGMFGAHGVQLPATLGAHLGGLKSALDAAGIGWYQGGTSRFIETWGWVAAASAIAFALPNTQQIMHRFAPALDAAGGMATATRLAWRPARRHAVLVGTLAVLGLLSLNRPTDFLYFQF
ncbi:MBOAT family O-acyltransferase [Pseudoduganella albidiflava]|uniref:Probable alginate O-acetylase AlgI n=1 Tax=Pseudoduganella albidiflava TaxID=321983 RepID=A0A411WZ42_9BURK|nr:MBOAT family protein [Pseudoduganella albidiflava]QBI01979.1 MBOAT family protein [Pseudoduganella albidiflava]GGY38049.1 alginate O-acetylation protein [Pseudoduganella albidiflava]